MVLKRKLIYTLLFVIVLLILLEIIARSLLRPNMISVVGDPSFLLKTTWSQTGAYAKNVALDDDAGCWAVAIAQIAHYHKLNPTGNINYTTSSGDRISVNLDDYTFSHQTFVSAIKKETPEHSKEQVARYIYYIAALIYTNFGSSGYVEHTSMVERLEKHLGCEVRLYDYNEESYLSSKDEIRELITREIDSDHPLMFYFDNGKDFGHAVALDGYLQRDDVFLVHLNQGFGGKYDGWYNLFDKIFGIRDDLHTRFLITFKPKKQKE